MFSELRICQIDIEKLIAQMVSPSFKLALQKWDEAVAPLRKLHDQFPRLRLDLPELPVIKADGSVSRSKPQ